MPLRTAAAYVALGTVASRVTGLLRFVALAWVLGQTLSPTRTTSPTRSRTCSTTSCSAVSLSATFVPVFVERLANRTASDAPALDLGGRARCRSSSCSSTPCSPCSLAPWIIDAFTALNPRRTRRSSTGSHQHAAVATTLLRWFGPQILCYGLLSLVAALLNVRGRFVAPAWAPIVNNVVCIGVLVWFGCRAGHSADLVSVEAPVGQLILLGLGTPLGVALQAVALVPSLVRAGGLRLRGGASTCATTHSAPWPACRDGRSGSSSPTSSASPSCSRSRSGTAGDRPRLGVHLRLCVLADALRGHRGLGHGGGHPGSRRRWTTGRPRPSRSASMAGACAARCAIIIPASVGLLLLARPSWPSCSATDTARPAADGHDRCSPWPCSPSGCPASAATFTSAGCSPCSARRSPSTCTWWRTGSTSCSPSLSATPRRPWAHLVAVHRLHGGRVRGAGRLPRSGSATSGHPSVLPALARRGGVSPDGRRRPPRLQPLGVDQLRRSGGPARGGRGRGRGHVRRGRRMAGTTSRCAPTPDARSTRARPPEPVGALTPAGAPGPPSPSS